MSYGLCARAARSASVATSGLQDTVLVPDTLARLFLDLLGVVGLDHEQQVDVAVRRHLAPGAGAVEDDPLRSDGLDQRGRHPLEQVGPRPAVGAGARPFHAFPFGVRHVGMFA